MLDNSASRPADILYQTAGSKDCRNSANSFFMVAIYCGSRSGNDPIYGEHIRLLAELLSDDGRFGLVFGGGPGLMKQVGQEFYKRDRPVVPITTTLLAGIESQGVEGTDAIARCIDTREIFLRSVANGTVVAPGGMGSLKEALGDMVGHQMRNIENTWNRPQERERPSGPLLILNTKKYYNRQIAMLKHAVREGFATTEHLSSFKVCQGPEETFQELVTMQERGQWTPKDLDPRNHIESEMRHLIALGHGYNLRVAHLTA